ncbi:hypothetical protein BmHoA_00102 [Borrelia miyamotoi]|uniref:hypothetical protein n=1 Tax=Borrelia miyamotoi TaxID=47466 RepID=UPI001C76EDFE|nr:hypothetical protein [Borrelia miyamotoi]BCR19053.1 hypothetical protein BmHoA_00102 [Borrelia miyamotoi]BCR19886.1 hypothetical protein BmHoB_00103 [Borrelia miyamotoi]
MQVKILCKILLMTSTLMLFSNEQLGNNLKPVSNVKEAIIGKKSSHQCCSKEKTKINKSHITKYPQKKEIHSRNIIKKKHKNPQTNKKQNIKIPINNIVQIRKSGKINYPHNNINTQSSKNSKKNIRYNIKVYPTHEKEKFTKLKEINKINKKIKKDFALIGPILEDQLDKITKVLYIKGYNELEYIRID